MKIRWMEMESSAYMVFAGKPKNDDVNVSLDVE